MSIYIFYMYIWIVSNRKFNLPFISHDFPRRRAKPLSSSWARMLSTNNSDRYPMINLVDVYLYICIY